MLSSPLIADNTCLKDLVAEQKQLQEISDHKDAEYLEQFHSFDVKFEQIQASLVILMNKQQATSSLNSLATTLGNNHNPFQLRNVKLDFPKFDGFDVLDWLFKADQFFWIL